MGLPEKWFPLQFGHNFGALRLPPAQETIVTTLEFTV